MLGAGGIRPSSFLISLTPAPGQTFRASHSHSLQTFLRKNGCVVSLFSKLSEHRQQNYKRMPLIFTQNAESTGYGSTWCHPALNLGTAKRQKKAKENASQLPNHTL